MRIAQQCLQTKKIEKQRKRFFCVSFALTIETKLLRRRFRQTWHGLLWLVCPQAQLPVLRNEDAEPLPTTRPHLPTAESSLRETAVSARDEQNLLCGRVPPNTLPCANASSTTLSDTKQNKKTRFCTENNEAAFRIGSSS